MVKVLQADNMTSDSRRAPARSAAEGAVGAVLAVIHARLLAEARPELRGLLSQLTAMILPYRGRAAAESELARRAPRSRRSASVAADPLREIDMRLTYRTIRVLLAIAELGEAGRDPNGRQVADAAGISDQGQMSKLLARLVHLGLIRNGARGRNNGEPNAWSLTPKGEAVEQAVRMQTMG